MGVMALPLSNAYWQMTSDPFSGNGGERASLAGNAYLFESDDYKNCTSRVNYLLAQKGFGLITGLPGTGKTFTLQSITEGLNKNLYKVIYSPMSSLTTMEFYRSMAFGLDLTPAHKKIDMFRQIQERILVLAKDKRITPVFICDEAQYLNTAIINDLKIIFNFEMDSLRPAVVIITGLPAINNTLLKHVHEAIAQRIIVSYRFTGLTRVETESYITSALNFANASNSIFSPAAIEALFAGCEGSIRKLNAIISTALLIGEQRKISSIDSETVMMAINERIAA